MEETHTTYCDGRLTVDLTVREMRMSHWLAAPRITHRATNRVLADLRESLWDVVAAAEHAHALELTLRRYPGDGRPVVLTVDADTGALRVAGAAVAEADLERALDARARPLPG